MGIFAELDSPLIDDARRFVMHELPEKLKDPAFLKDVELIALGDPNVHKELVLLRFFERVGAYVDEGLIDGEIIYKAANARLMSAWVRAQGADPDQLRARLVSRGLH